MRRWLWVGALVVAVAVAAWAVMARGGSTAPVRYLTARVARLGGPGERSTMVTP